MRIRALTLLTVLYWSSLLRAERWEMQYFYDENKTSMVLNDIEFCSANRGVAVGAVVDRRGAPSPVALVTTDGGKQWVVVKTKEVGLTLFFLNETAGWMVTPGGIWFTDEAGRSWRRIRKEQGLERVYFLNAEHGYAIGAQKRVIETKDGGKSWTPLKAAENLKTSAERTAFHGISFTGNKTGVIVGQARARSDARRPAWMDPEMNRRERPSLSVFLQTKDGGTVWDEKTNSIFGRISQLQLAASGIGLALLEFEHSFDYPSEVYRLDLRNGKTERALRSKDLAITDVALVPSSGAAFAAGFEATGSVFKSPIPGKLRLLRSDNLSEWKSMDVDYRAVAGRVSIGAWDAEHAWVATDTGMILQMVRD